MLCNKLKKTYTKEKLQVFDQKPHKNTILNVFFIYFFEFFLLHDLVVKCYVNVDIS